MFFDANGVLYRRKRSKIQALQEFLVSKDLGDEESFREAAKLKESLARTKESAGKGTGSRDDYFRHMGEAHGLLPESPIL